jgi:hypothetical protein
MKGYAVMKGMIDDDQKVAGTMYWDVKNMIKCEVEDMMLTLEPLE